MKIKDVCFILAAVLSGTFLGYLLMELFPPAAPLINDDAGRAFRGVWEAERWRVLDEARRITRDAANG